MEEREWLESVDPAAMLRHLTSVLSLRLTSSWDEDDFPETVWEPRDQPPISDRQAEFLVEACRNADDKKREKFGFGKIIWDNLPKTNRGVLELADYWCRLSGRPKETAHILRDIMGNPFRPVQRGPTDLVHVINGYYQNREDGWPIKKLDYLDRISDVANRYECGVSAIAGTIWVSGPGIRLEADGKPIQGYFNTELRNDPTVTRLAQAMYDNNDFSAMPILGDALEEAGCTNEDVLNHCRGLERCIGCMGTAIVQRMANEPSGRMEKVWCRNGVCDGWIPLRGPHVRGCWVLDLILNKS